MHIIIGLLTLSRHIVDLYFCCRKEKKEQVNKDFLCEAHMIFFLILSSLPRKLSLAESDRAYPSGTNV